MTTALRFVRTNRSICPSRCGLVDLSHTFYSLSSGTLFLINRELSSLSCTVFDRLSCTISLDKVDNIHTTVSELSPVG